MQSMVNPTMRNSLSIHKQAAMEKLFTTPKKQNSIRANSPDLSDYKSRINYFSNLSDSLTKKYPSKRLKRGGSLQETYKNNTTYNNNIEEKDEQNILSETMETKNFSEDIKKEIDFENEFDETLHSDFNDNTLVNNEITANGSYKNIYHDNNINNQVKMPQETSHDSIQDDASISRRSITELSRRNSNNSSSYRSTTRDITSSFDSFSLNSDESVDDDIMSEWSRLKTVLSHIDPTNLREHLQKSMRTKDYSMVISLSMLLPKSKFTGDTSHCARCHKEFNESYGDKTCVIQHRKRDISIISEDNEVVVYQCERCCVLFKLQHGTEYSKKIIDIEKYSACFVGYHTVHGHEVVYEPEGVAQRCEDNGCVEFYV